MKNEKLIQQIKDYLNNNNLSERKLIKEMGTGVFFETLQNIKNGGNVAKRDEHYFNLYTLNNNLGKGQRQDLAFG